MATTVFWALDFFIWCGLFTSTVLCQAPTPYSDLSPEPFIASNDGTFTWPAGDTGIFDEGRSMTISWTSLYPSVNLYIIFNQTINEAIGHQSQIVTGYTFNECDWVVDCGGDCSAAFVLRAVNATGDQQALNNGGFWSRQFWIRPTAVTMSSTTTPSSTSSASTSSTSTSSSQTSSPASATSSPSSETTPSPAADQSNDSSNSNTTAIGVGVGVGIGVALFLVGAVLTWRHRRRGSNQQQPQVSAYAATTSPSVDQEQSSPWPQEVKGSGYHSPVEVPAVQMEPQELPGREAQ